jgi:hypothetical protein
VSYHLIGFDSSIISWGVTDIAAIAAALLGVSLPEICVAAQLQTVQLQAGKKRIANDPSFLALSIHNWAYLCI